MFRVHEGLLGSPLGREMEICHQRLFHGDITTHKLCKHPSGGLHGSVTGMTMSPKCLQLSTHQNIILVIPNQ